MDSSELLQLVNAARAEMSEPLVRNNDFIARCKDELDDHYESFVVTNPNGTKTERLRLNRDQCMLVAMRESKAVRQSVVKKLNELAAPRELTRMDILKLAMESEEARIKAEAERDHAIATKAQIGSRREASAMAAASHAKREVEKLKAALGESQKWATVKAVEKAMKSTYPWLPLKKWCDGHEVEVRKVPDPLYGSVNSYPDSAWAGVYDINISELFA